MTPFECGCLFDSFNAVAFTLGGPNPLEPGWEVFDHQWQFQPCAHHKKYLWNVFRADGRPWER